ncbi:DUF6461 domain-containing protein [Yinghuangia sp. YIM S10712]|uniref:DUF6461 domain-containing protein n=1 Tax=Yinghuangia sp. YIM S10712 TaxID=3436930 RepID=UPI003F52E50F
MTSDESAYAQYLWIHDHGELTYYTMFFVRGLGVPEVCRRLEVAPSALRPMTRDERCAGRPFIRVHALGDWALVIEPDGFDAFTDKAARELSLGTEAVMVNRNVLAHAKFWHVVDGELWTMFDAVAPDDRWGSRPDRLVEPMRRIGLDPDPHPIPDDDDDLWEDGPFHWDEKNLALAEHVTGIRLTPEMLRDPAPSAPSPFRE